MIHFGFFYIQCTYWYLSINHMFYFDFAYSMSPSAQAAGHRHFAAHEVVALNNSSTNKSTQFQWGLYLSRYFANLWCILFNVCVEIDTKQRSASGLNSISSSMCYLTWKIIQWNLIVHVMSISKSFIKSVTIGTN